MSIIHEALKKAGDHKSFDRSSSILSPAREKDLRDSAFSRKKKRLNWGPVFVMTVLVLITGPLLAPIFSSPFKNTTAPLLVPSYQQTLASPQPMTTETVADTRQAQFGIEEALVAPVLPPAGITAVSSPSAPMPNFFMNGIVYSQNESYCIINGRVVKVGEKIDGATLVSVSNEKATLAYGDRKIDLWMNS